MQDADPEEWFGTPAAARYLGVALRTVYALIDDGAFPAYRHRRVIRIRRRDLDEYLERVRVEPGSLGHLHPLTDHGEQG